MKMPPLSMFLFGFSLGLTNVHMPVKQNCLLNEPLNLFAKYSPWYVNDNLETFLCRGFIISNEIDKNLRQGVYDENSYAIFLKGILLFYGVGEAKDEKQGYQCMKAAYNFFDRAHASGDLCGTNWIVEYETFFHGNHGRNHELIRQYVDLLIKSNETLFYPIIGTCYEYGFGHATNLRLAKHYYALGTDFGEHRCQRSLAILIRTEKQMFSESELSKYDSFLLLEKSAAQGDLESLTFLGEKYLAENKDSNLYKKGALFIQVAARKCYPLAIEIAEKHGISLVP